MSGRREYDSECLYCDSPAVSGELCEAHLKRRQRNQPMSGELAKYGRRYSSARERFEEAMYDYANADDNGTDDDLRRAFDAARKAAGAYLKQPLGGRPRKVEYAEAARVVQQLGGARPAAEQLQVSVRTVRRALSQMRKAEG